MKKYFQVSIYIILAIGLFIQSVNACTIIISPLRKEFRNSTNVFIGEVVNITEVPKDYKDKKERLVGGIVKFRIEKTWKGKKQTEISLLSDIINTGCGNGSPIDYFRKGEKYLIFAEKDYVNFYKSSMTANSEGKIRKLNDFGFRLWARTFPF